MNIEDYDDRIGNVFIGNNKLHKFVTISSLENGYEMHLSFIYLCINFLCIFFVYKIYFIYFLCIKKTIRIDGVNTMLNRVPTSEF